MITKTTSEIWRLFYCCNLGWDSFRLLEKYYRYIATLVSVWFAKLWIPDIETIMKYDYFMKKKNKKSWNRVFSRNLCDSVEIRKFHTYARYHQRIKSTLSNYFSRFSTMLYEALPAETRLTVCRGNPVIKAHGMFNYNSKIQNSNQLSIFFLDVFIFCQSHYIGEMSGYALCEEKPRGQVW